MANRRMFSADITESDAFLDMPLSTQALYLHLSMNADDEGFVGNPKRISRMVGCGDDDAKLLIYKRFIIAFDSGVIVIKHWKMSNNIRRDRIKQTAYTKEKETLAINENGSYTEARNLIDCRASDNMTSECQPDDRQMSDNMTTTCQTDVRQHDDNMSTRCQHSIVEYSRVEDSIDKTSIDKKKKQKKL